MPPKPATPPKPVAGAAPGWTGPGENQAKPWVDILNHPPPGIPKNFWKVYLYGSGDGKTTSGMQVMQKLSAATTDEQRYQLYQNLLNGPGGVHANWESFGPGGQDTWLKAEKQGNPYNPFTADGKAFTETADRKDTQERGIGFAEDFLKTAIPDFEKVLAEANAGNQAAIDRLKGVVDNIQDPEVSEYLDDYVSQAATAGPSQEAIQRQIGDYDKLKSLSDPTITAEERLMMEMSRRKQEQDLKASRGAFANDLQARGMYGSGAELTMNLSAAQEAAQRRSLEEMQAQAHAQQRAMDSLFKATDLGTSIRGSEAQESQFRGSAADRAKEFKMGLKENAEKWRSELQAKLNNDKFTREQGLTTSTLSGNQQKLYGGAQVLGAQGTGTQGKISALGTFNPGVQQMGMYGITSAKEDEDDGH